ncbi:MAG: hydrolase [Ponticaulis sp.]|nr:hydrolase [Ponticaulis sp.]
MQMTRRTMLGASSAALLASKTSEAQTGVTPGRSATIDVHAHFLPEIYSDALASAGLKLLDGGMPVPKWSEDLALATMDQVGISGALLSVSSPFLSFLNSEDEARRSRAINIEASKIRDRHPNRFGGLAILPLSDLTAAMEELKFALDTLELDGVAIPTNIGGEYLGHERFRPLLAELNARRVTTFVHPTSPCCFEAFNLGLPAPMLEFPFETTRAVTDLVLSGRIAEFSDIEFILPHAGGTLPYLAQRIAAIGQLPVVGPKQLAAPETLKALASMNYDLALSATPAQYGALRQLVPVTNILYGSDFPFTPAPAVAAADMAIDQLGLNDEEARQIRSGNASRLFPGFAGRCCGAHAH